jgi:hypothetical protein
VLLAQTTQARLVADKVSGGVDLEQLRATLLIDAQQDGDHRQRPHVPQLGRLHSKCRLDLIQQA